MKKLLSITNLKKYFPLAKKSLFQKEQFYVRANEDISIDIYEGETFGLVGESGCGKSTLGRVILQLYEQTAGTTMYYGRSLAEVAPKYVFDTLKRADKYIAAWKKAEKKASDAAAKCEALGEGASFHDLQTRNLCEAEAKSALWRVAKILGGFTVEGTAEGAAALLEVYRQTVAEAKGKGNPEAKRTAEDKLGGLRVKYSGKGEFDKYEEMLDDGIDLSRLTVKEMRDIRRDLQIIFQDPYSSLNPRMTVGQIIEEGLVTHKFFKPHDKKAKDYIVNQMEECGLQDYMYARYPHQFSGGQRQRICIARSLAVKPKFVVCDECVSALDVSIQSQIINLLQELKEKEKLTYLFISHNLSVVRYISDRIGVMYLGNMVEVADTDTIFRDPRHPYTVALLSSIPTTDFEESNRERIILGGNIPSPIKPPSGCKFHTRCYMACDKCKRVPPPFVEVEPGHFVACHNLDRKVDENGKYLFEINRDTSEL
ncbi:MAG: ATP-binding cassette domain-containing protein [Ruminococcaceae bacterium]|nr:ATP-binding cassette domain-containing protein [Oscillospiraceae bacterium]